MKNNEASKSVIFVDVDDTLVRTVGSKRIPIMPVITKIRELHREGHPMYLWSSGGEQYARATAIEFGISDCFLGFLPKPQVYIDDQSVDQWRFCRHVLPGNVHTIAPLSST